LGGGHDRSVRALRAAGAPDENASFGTRARRVTPVIIRLRRSPWVQGAPPDGFKLALLD